MPIAPDLSDAAPCSSDNGSNAVIDRMCLTFDDAKALVVYRNGVDEVERALQGCNLLTRVK